MEREGGSEREGARGRERGRERESERARVKTRDRQRKDEAKQVCRGRISARGGGWRIGERWDFRLEARERASPISARDHGIRSTEEPPVHSRDIAQQQAQAEEGRRLGSVGMAGATPVGPHSLRLLAEQFLVRVRIECHHAPPPRLSSSAAAAIRSLRLRRRRRLGLLRGASRVAALRLGRLVLDEVRVLPLSTSAGLASTSRPGGGLLVRRLRRDAITGKPPADEED